MKKITNFQKYMGQSTSSTDLMNYELQSSSSINYSTSKYSSSPESFPVLMENGIIVRYELVKFSTELLEEKQYSENNLT
jgi:hypothetical protein